MPHTRTDRIWTSRQTGKHLLLLLTLDHHADDAGACQLAQAELAAHLDCEPRTVRRIAADLEQAGCITIEQTRPLTYHLTLAGEPDTSDTSAGESTAKPDISHAEKRTLKFKVKDKVKEDSSRDTSLTSLSAHPDISHALQQRGVYAAPAEQIAQRASAAGLDINDVIALFEYHLTATGGNIRLAVWRLKHNPLVPAASDTRQQRRGPVPADGQGSRAAFTKTLTDDPSETPSDSAPPPETSRTLWQDTLDVLRGQLPRATYDLHLAGSTQIDRNGETLTVAVRHDSARAWLTGPLYERICEAVRWAGGNERARVEFRVRSS